MSSFVSGGGCTEAEYRGNAPDCDLTGGSSSAGGTACDRDDRDGTQRFQDGKGRNHYQEASFSGNTGGGERGLLGQDRNTDAEPDDGKEVLSGWQDRGCR